MADPYIQEMIDAMMQEGLSHGVAHNLAYAFERQVSMNATIRCAKIIGCRGLSQNGEFVTGAILGDDYGKTILGIAGDVLRAASLGDPITVDQIEEIIGPRAEWETSPKETTEE